MVEHDDALPGVEEADECLGDPGRRRDGQRLGAACERKARDVVHDDRVP